MHTIYIKRVLPIKFIIFTQKKILERPLINYTVQPTGVLLISSIY